MEKIENNGEWYLAALVERFQRDDEDADNDSRRCLVHENTYLIKADDLSHAYDKAVKLGQEECSDISPGTDDKGRQGKWVFDGISELIPVYEDIQDEAELIYMEYDGISVKRAKGMTLKKHEWLKLRQQPPRARKPKSDT